MIDTAKASHRNPAVPQTIVESLDDTGERMVPEKSHARCFWEHIYRYRFAAPFVENKRVLDIACGEGYGTAALSKAGAVSVIGMDISAEVCDHANRKYGIDARVGSAESLPLPDESIDVITSFETIEHIEAPAKFLDECIRVLAPSGLLVVSTPNKEVYSEENPHNSFHCSEMYLDELVSLLRPRFPEFEIYTQSPKMASLTSERSFAADTSPWFRIRGPGRLREMLRAGLCPHIRGEVGLQYRQSPVETILSSDRRLSYLLNPYLVRNRSRRGREWPVYFVAVAVKSAEGIL